MLQAEFEPMLRESASEIRLVDTIALPTGPRSLRWQTVIMCDVTNPLWSILLAGARIAGSQTQYACRCAYTC